jgi:hypothetical protein
MAGLYTKSEAWITPGFITNNSVLSLYMELEMNVISGSMFLKWIPDYSGVRGEG